ncbi:hypothetical protein ACHQM5_005113 [Ranunculus cassubicifolius]
MAKQKASMSKSKAQKFINPKGKKSATMKKKKPDNKANQISREEMIELNRKRDEFYDQEEIRVQKAIELYKEAKRKEMQDIGFVFIPSDVVLVNHYLKYKTRRSPMDLCPIDEVDVYANHPRSLTDQFNPSGGVWYFFTKSRPGESSDIMGVWKFGEKKDVTDNGVKVGVRQELEFHEEGDQNGNGKYKMIEYQLHPATSAPLFVCKLFDGRGN